MNSFRTIRLSILAGIFCALTQSVPAVVAPEHGSITNMDKRITGQQRVTIVPERAAALGKARARIPDLQVDFDDVIASPKWIRSQKGFLTGPTGDAVNGPPGQRAAPAAQANDPHEPAKRFLDAHAELFGHGAEVLQGARITREFVGAHNGLRTVVWEQRLDDIPLFQSVLIAHITKNGELVNLSSLFVPTPDQAAKLDPGDRDKLAAAPPITPHRAVVEAAKSIGEVVKLEDVAEVGPAPNDPKASRKLAAPSLSGEVGAQLVWLPMSRSELRLCWKVKLANRDWTEAFLVTIDAQTGEDIVRQSMTFHLNETSYRVFTSDSPSPFSPGHSTPSTTQPSVIQRNIQTWSALNVTASPNGWIDEGDYETVGNNVDSRLDWFNANYAYRQGEGNPNIRPSSFPSRVFDPSLTLPGDPIFENPWAGVVQLFYWCNWRTACRPECICSFGTARNPIGTGTWTQRSFCTSTRMV